MIVGILKETAQGERRVAATPDSVIRLRQLGFAVVVDSGAGLPAGFDDAAYGRARHVARIRASAVIAN